MRRLATLAALLLATTLSACGDQPVADSPAETSPTETAAPGAPAEEPTPTPADDGFEPVPVTPACRAAFAEMAEAYEVAYAADDYTLDELDALELPPLTACETGAQWLSAARENPEAVGFTRADAVNLLALQSRCTPSFEDGRSSPVCVDALAVGLAE